MTPQPAEDALEEFLHFLNDYTDTDCFSVSFIKLKIRTIRQQQQGGKP